ncbi:type I polyketide synthase, partial [Streptomyces triticirhizae]
LAQHTHPNTPTTAPLRTNTPELTTYLTTLTHHPTTNWTTLTTTNTPNLPLPTYPFQHHTYWLRPTTNRRDNTRHPLLTTTTTLAHNNTVLITGQLSLADHPWLADHTIAGTVLFPGTGFLDLALYAATQVNAAGVEDLTIEAPLVLPEHSTVRLQISIEDRTLTLHARTQGEDEPWTRHATATLTNEPPATPEPPAAWPPPGAQAIPLDDTYPQLAERGYDYGPTFQGLTALWREDDTLHAEIALPPDTPTAGHTLHPALLDAALHPLLVDALRPGGDEAVRIPFSWSGIAVPAVGGVAAVRVSLTPTGADAVTLTLADDEGAPLTVVERLSLRAVDPERLRPAGASGEELLLHLDWSPAQAGDAEPESPRDWAVVGERGAELAAALGVSAVFDDLAALAAHGDVPGTVLLHVPPRDPAAGEDAADAARAACRALLTELPAWLGDERFAAARRLVVVTRDAVAAGSQDRTHDPVGAALWGLVRTAQAENPDRLWLLDLDDTAASRAAVPAALAVDEPQLAVRNGTVHVNRLDRAARDAGLAAPAGGAPWRLGSSGEGTLENLALLPAPDAARALAPGEVRVAVRAVGVNFRDVLIALGTYPGRAAIGGEAAGVVVETGPDVAGLAVGDRVMGLFPDGAGPLAVTERALLAPVPAGWTFAQAAATPVAFLTAYHGLVDLGGLTAGESVLVHAAAGGVGMAAVQLARHLGAEVYGTASPGKWDTLRGQGFDEAHLANSRTLEFEERLRAATGGRGVDVVLDSLAGEFVDASLRLLPRGGRFLEMGKADVRDPDEVAAAHPGVAYRAFDMMEAGPARIAEMLDALSALFASGALRPLPLGAWDVRRAPDAFRRLGQGHHTGKAVLTLPAVPDPDGTVLITGGSGALAALTARHLVAAHGHRRLLLASRRGPDAPGAAELAAELAALGAEVTAVACDVSDRAQLAAVLDAIPAAHPLTAVVHTAGRVDDVSFARLDEERLETVFRPKADAAWHLHELTRHLDLAAFVLYSSVAGTLGNPGQANYAAANAFLDALARHRHTLGLPATSLAWGLWDLDAGMAGALDAVDRERLAAGGIAPLTAERGLAALDAALAGDRAAVVPLRLDQGALRQRAAADELPPVLRALTRTQARRRSAAGSASSLARRLAALPEAERERALVEVVGAQVAAVLGHAENTALDPRRAFRDLGFDSLSALELRNRVAAATGERLSPTLVFDHPTPLALAAHLRTRLLGSEPAMAVSGSAARDADAPGDDDAIAIVGMACRFPGGVASPEELWRMVAEGRDAIGDFPTDRGWDLDALHNPDPTVPGTSYTRQGGFLDDAAGFDPDFFGINPREALAMDPQQRLLLETAWEAFERAGIAPESLRGSDTGVFAGVITSDYVTRLAAQVPDSVEGYVSTGTTTSVASGRLAYTFGLEGPAVTVDTACSSSLVALHLAMRALRAGECGMALVGGATVMAGPTNFVEFSRQRALSVDGRCKAFAASADGTGWGEGVGMLLIERLSDARRNGHRVLAVVRGSAVNQDGASNGLSAPNGPSQERVIRQALANAGLAPADVDAVEAHGTGTKLGDPIEAQALLATYGSGRTAENPLLLGSLKSNIGHTLAAAGVAGVIKMVMALREGVLPRTLHVDEPTPHVDWSEGTVELLTEPRPWHTPGGDRPRRAAVSSFGISGTNAHVILEQAPEPARDPARDAAPDASTPQQPQVTPWVLTARSKPALADLAARLHDALRDRPEADTTAVARSLATTRSHFDHRAVAVAGTRDELLDAVRTLANGQDNGALVTGTADAGGRTAFVFPGQGSQWLGMAAGLWETAPAFRDRLRECADALAPHTDWNLVDVLTAAPGDEEAAALLERVDVIQPALFAVMVSLAALWRAHGVHPDAVVGHSQGEIAAACVAGALDLDDAARVVALRSRALRAIAGLGGMVSLPLPVARAEELIAPHGGRLSVAAVNGPAATVVSGDREAIDALLARCAADGLRARDVPVDYASHCAHVEAIEADLAELLAGLSPRATDIAFYSTLEAAPLDTTTLDGDYWYRNLRHQVRLLDTVRLMLADGYRLFVESSAHPVLVTALGDTIETFEDAPPPTAHAVGTLRRDHGDLARFATSLAEAFTRGAPADLTRLLPEPPAEGTDAEPFVDLPTYPFQRERYWLQPSAGAGDVTAAGLETPDHPFLAAAVTLADSETVLLTARLSTADHPWLADHAVADTVLFPGTGFVDLALHAATHVGLAGVEDLTIEAPLALPEPGAVQLQITVAPPDEHGRRAVAVHARPEGDDAGWTRHATATLTPEAAAVPTLPAAWPPPGAREVPLPDLYAELAGRGYAYGPMFQGLTALWHDGDVRYAEVTLPADTDVTGHALHPALLDAALHPLLVGAGDALRVPFSWSGVTRPAGSPEALRVRLAPTGADTAELTLADAGGAPVARVASLTHRPLDTAQLAALGGDAVPLRGVELT